VSFTFAPASSFTERAGLFVSLTGGTNSGKTFSAMRLARGIAGPDGKIAVLDTEGGRTLHLKDAFAFDANVMDAPFRPERFSQAALAAEQAGYAALVIDSFSMEWVGVGGVLDWQAAEHKRLGGSDAKKGQSWIAPKMAHKAMVYALLQRRIPIIFSIRGEETFIPPNTKVFKSITNRMFPFEVTVSFRLESERKGYLDLSDPKSWKMEGAHQEIFRHGDRLSEEHGAALAAWARGERAPPSEQARAPASASAEPARMTKRELFAAARTAAAKGQDAFDEWVNPLPDAAYDLLGSIWDELKGLIAKADDGFPGDTPASGEAA
jgi:hypothetical protein